MLLAFRARRDMPGVIAGAASQFAEHATMRQRTAASAVLALVSGQGTSPPGGVSCQELLDRGNSNRLANGCQSTTAQTPARLCNLAQIG